MKYCIDCGNPLTEKENGVDGLVPYCEHCQKFVYPLYNSAISTIIIKDNKVLLIKQYHNPEPVLVAGYINKGENAKEALYREIKEETSLTLKRYDYNDNFYYPKTETLIHNYIAYCEGDIEINDEVDNFSWYSYHDAYQSIKKNSLAKKFLLLGLIKLHLEKEIFVVKEDRIALYDHKDQDIAHVIINHEGNVDTIQSVFVDPNYRGGTIAKNLVFAAYELIKQQNHQCKLVCSYAIKIFHDNPDMMNIVVDE